MSLLNSGHLTTDVQSRSKKVNLEKVNLAGLLNSIERELLPNLQIKSIHPDHPVVVETVSAPWKLLGTGNYAGVFYHVDYDHLVVKVYAPGREGWSEEVEVYRRLGSHSAYSKCWYAADNFLVLERLHGITLYDCLHQGLSIPSQVIKDIDLALEYARSLGLYPHDVHGRNVMMSDNQGLVVDVSDFLHQEPCFAWKDLKKAYYWLYLPLLSWHNLSVPYFMLDWIRFGYRFWRRWLRVATAAGK